MTKTGKAAVSAFLASRSEVNALLIGGHNPKIAKEVKKAMVENDRKRDVYAPLYLKDNLKKGTEFTLDHLQTAFTKKEYDRNVAKFASKMVKYTIPKGFPIIKLVDGVILGSGKTFVVTKNNPETIEAVAK